MQFAKPAWQEAIAHCPPVQVPVPFCTAGQEAPQAPQCSVDVLVELSQPSAYWLLQSPKPALHVAIAHCPFAQLLVPFGTGAQALPHAPQWSVVRRSASQPSEARPLQLLKPVLHAAT